MSNKQKKHYSIVNIEKEGSLFNLIYGERSNGKSYQAKHLRCIEKYLFGIKEDHYTDYRKKEEILTRCIEKGTRFILMRRLLEEITADKIEAYFQDVDIYKLTNHQYNCITTYRKTIYLANYESKTGKTTRGEKIGYVVALSIEQNYAGGSYLDVTDIIFEEFMSRGTYLKDEPSKLMNFYCTVDRKRGTTRLWLIGNTISRVCPYIYDWGLHEIISKQKQGTIKSLWLDTNQLDDDGNKIMVKCSIEYCEDTGRSSFTIGKHSDMLNSGSWQTDPQPLLPMSKKEYKILYRIGFQYQNFKFIGELLSYKNLYCWFIYPYEDEFKDNIIIFSDIVKINKNWQRDIYNITIKSDRLQQILNTFRSDNIFYASDLCGTDFKQVIDFVIKR